MADDSNEKPGSRKKKSAVNAPTIELKATELSVSGPAEPETPATAASATEAVPDAISHAPADPAPMPNETPVAAAPIENASSPGDSAPSTAELPEAGARKPPDATPEATISAAAPKLDVFGEPQPSFFQRPLAAGLIGGVAGAALMVIATSALRPPAPPVDAQTEQALAAMRQELQSTKDALDRAVGRLTVAENDAKNASDLANAANGVATEAKTASDAAQKDVAAVAAAGTSGSNGAPVDLSGVEARLSAVESLAAAAPQSAITALEPRLAALEARPASGVGAGAGAAAPDRAAIVAVGLTTLAAAIESGRPFVAELRAASAIVKDDDKLAALAGFADKGAPSTTSLARDFEAVAPTLLEAINKEATGLAPDADVFARLLNSASQIVIIRKVGDESSDAAAPVTRTREALLRGDLPAAIAAFDTLPETVRGLATVWRQSAKSALDASDAVAKLRAEALAALGG